MNIEIYKETKIYIMSPYRNIGGARSMHQLGQVLVNNGYKVFLYYYDRVDTESCSCEDVSIPISTIVDDDEKNYLIVPETHIELSLPYKKINKIIWWLSLHYYRVNDVKWRTHELLKRKGLSDKLFFLLYPIVSLKDLFNDENKYFKQIDSSLGEYYHFYNCEYVKEFLCDKKIRDDKMAYLCGPVTDNFQYSDRESLICRKKNIIAVNPIKADPGILNKFVYYVKKLDNSIQVIEIKNMSSDMVKDVLTKTKVYVDLGYFPGPERIPREAVLLYCNILTSTMGAAHNKIDVPISSQHKEDIKINRMNIIAQKAVKMVYNYKSEIEDYDLYRQKVVNQIERFEEDILCIFEKK